MKYFKILCLFSIIFHYKRHNSVNTIIINKINLERKNIMNSKGLDYTLLTIAIIGAINWGLVGFFRLDLVAFLFGNMTLLSRIIYAAVGICGLYLISMFGRVRDIAE